MNLRQIGYNQTEVEFPNGPLVLFSYSTPVAAYVPGKGYVRTDTNYSKTTTKHINAWLRDRRITDADVMSQDYLNSLGG